MEIQIIKGDEPSHPPMDPNVSGLEGEPHNRGCCVGVQGEVCVVGGREGKY